MSKPKNKIKIRWSPDFAYAIGLLVTDGNLSSDGRHINFTSKDKELTDNFLKALNTTISIGMKSRGGEKEKKYFSIGFSDVNFYRFLLTIGLMPAKSKIITKITLPNQYFFDFLRGHFDGDGSIYYYWDKRWKSSLMLYTSFASASKNHINWLRDSIKKRLHIKGHITKDSGGATLQLKYAKKESIKLLKNIYRKNNILLLTRKYLKVKEIFAKLKQDI